MDKMMIFHNWFVVCHSIGNSFLGKERSFSLFGGRLQPKRCGSDKAKGVYDQIKLEQSLGKNVIHVKCSASALASALSGIESTDGNLSLHQILY